MDIGEKALPQRRHFRTNHPRAATAPADRNRAVPGARAGSNEGIAARGRAWSAWPQYLIDCAQRAVIFWDTLRQRGNNYLEHVQQGQPPVLHFKYETVLDGRTLERPVNYALVRIIPPEGVTRRSARSARTSSSTRAAATAPASAASRTTPRSASRCARDTRSTSSSSSAIRNPGRRCSTCARRSASSCTRCARCIRTAQARDRRQLPGRLGGDDARGLRARRDRAARDRRRADVLLGRRVARGRGRQPDALRGRHPRRHVARLALGGPGQRQIRRRAPGAELRVPESGQHLRRQVLQGVRERRHRAARASSSSSAGGAATS